MDWAALEAMAPPTDWMTREATSAVEKRSAYCEMKRNMEGGVSDGCKRSKRKWDGGVTYEARSETRVLRSDVVDHEAWEIDNINSAPELQIRDTNASAKKSPRLR